METSIQRSTEMEQKLSQMKSKLSSLKDRITQLDKFTRGNLEQNK